MTQEPLTLYKLIVLYMLDQVDFPLTGAQVSDFILTKEYTSFLTLQQAISELNEAGLIATRSIGNRTNLLITGEGKNTLSFFENRISDTIKKEVVQYLKEKEMFLLRETVIYFLGRLSILPDINILKKIYEKYIIELAN